MPISPTSRGHSTHIAHLPQGSAACSEVEGAEADLSAGEAEVECSAVAVDQAGIMEEGITGAGMGAGTEEATGEGDGSAEVIQCTPRQCHR